MKNGNSTAYALLSDLIIGQEAICPDGLGRIAVINEADRTITIDTYINNRSCCWSMHNVKAVPIYNVPIHQLIGERFK